MHNIPGSNASIMEPLVLKINLLEPLKSKHNVVIRKCLLSNYYPNNVSNVPTIGSI